MAAHGGTISIDADRARARRWSPARSAASSAPAGWPTAIELDERALHRHRRHLLRHRADHRRRASRSRRPRTSARFLLNMPLVQIDSIGAGTGSFVRIDPNLDRPELGPDSAGVADRHRLARGRRRDGLGHRPQPRPRPRSTPTTSSAARSSSTSSAPAPRSSARSPSRSGSGSRRRPPGVIELFERRCATRPSAASSARATRPPTTRCSATAAAGRCTSPATPRASPYRDVLVPAWAAGFSAFGCACADFEYRYDRRSTCRSCRPTPTRKKRAHRRRSSTAAWLLLEERVARRVREVRRRRRRRHRFTAHWCGCSTTASSSTSRSSRRTSRSRSPRRRGHPRLIAAFEDAYAQDLRAPAPLAGARLPGHPGDRRAARCRSRSRRCRSEPPSRRHAAGRRRPARSGGADGYADTAIYELDDVRAGQTIDGPGDRRAPVDDLRDPARPPRPARRAPHLPPREARRPDAMAIDRPHPRARARPVGADRLGRAAAGRDARRLRAPVRRDRPLPRAPRTWR